MVADVCILGVGETGNQPTTPTLSYKELMYEAAARAYADAGVDARKDVESAVSAAEDFWWGTSITDEYLPDQIGVMQKPVCTVGGDGLHGVATAYMQIASGLFDVVVVEAHSKVSDVKAPMHVMNMAYEPFWFRPFGWSPEVTAGLEMARWLHDSKSSTEATSDVVETNRRNALQNPRAAYGAAMSASDVAASAVVADPLRRLDIATFADGATVLVLGSKKAANEFSGDPVWIRGLGWSNGSSNLDSREWAKADYAAHAAKRAFRMARTSAKDIDVAEVDDSYSYKQLQHVDALGLSTDGTVINPSGGCLGMGQTLEMNGATRLAEVVHQMRGQAGRLQVPDAKVGLAMAWRGVPTTSGAVAIVSKEAP